jgi:hypothetical protein
MPYGGRSENGLSTFVVEKNLFNSMRECEIDFSMSCFSFAGQVVLYIVWQDMMNANFVKKKTYFSIVAYVKPREKQ